ncbi:MAG: Ig-like domain repeat protein [Candidatus Korobacteraceae bacterium]
MRNVRHFPTVLSVAMCSLALSLFSQSLLAATVYTNARPVARVTKPVNDAKRVTLYGHVPQVVATAAVTGKARDMGRLDPKTPMQGMRLMLRSSPDQARELRRIVDEQQDKRTINYHQWVTPEEFGNAFGAHDDDIQKVTAWLTKQGFTVENVTKGKRVIQFSGTSGQVERAFQTSMHSYQVDGETHVSAATDISVPEALAPVIAGVNGLHNFFRKSHMVDVEKLSELQNNLKLGPAYTSSSSVHYVGPSDFATIYNTNPLLQAGINGTGVTIAIVGRSDILMSDVQTYRQLFNLPPNDPIFIHAGQDNGTEPGDDGESDLDVEISGGIAPNATVKFVIGTPTFTVDGITNSIEYIVENNVADIMSISYGSCEAVEGAGGNEFNNQIFEQAAAQGISVFVAAGDGGPAGCDLQGSQTYEVSGYATGAEASTPYSVAVGGTEFYGDQGAGYSTYWSATNNSLYLNSALSYIPEYPWNESRVASPIPTGDSGSDLWSGSGGISAYYLRPSWQQGPGINNSSDPALTLGNGATGLWVSSVNITNPGSGYTSAPTVTFTGGGCTAEPVATSVISGGLVTGLTFTGYTSHFQGFGCTSAPTIAFSGGGGTGAAATATVGQMQYPQPLISGVPHRLTPDLSLNAASGHDGTFFCSEGVCEIASNGALADAGIVGGTSVAAPSMAGIQALIDQANGGRQGMPGYIYYSLAAAQNTANCNSSGPPGPGSNCVFQDITLGNNLICGLAGSSCTAALTQAKIGFNAGTGYDMATGLGSPNAANLSNQWNNVVFNSSNTTLNLSQTSGINHGTAVTLSGTVSPGSGSGTPTGDVAFIVSQGAIGWVVNPNTGGPGGPGAFATLSGGSYSASLPNLPGGTYTVTARYGGDSTFASSLSAPVQVTVNSEGSTITITPQSITQTTTCLISPSNSFTYGQLVDVQIAVAGNSQQGVPTGTVAITDNGNPVGTVSLDSNGNGWLVAGVIPSTSCIYDYMFAQSPTLTGGTHQIGASYSGDATFQATTATPATITVTPLTPTLTLTAGATLINSGFADTLTATFGGLTSLTGSGSGSSGPTGTVTFTDTTTSTVLGTATVVPTVSFSGNIYTYGATAVGSTTGITQTGANSITASYSGDSNYSSLTSTAVAVTVGTGTATTTTVTSSANPTTLNGRPTFTATVAGGAGPTAGTVTFYDGTTMLGSGTVGAAHTATFRPASGAAFWGGTHNITAIFGGNATFMASTSPVFVETVTQGTVTIALTAKTAGNSGQNYTFAAVLTPNQTNATYAPNQSVVNFYDGATLIGTGQPQTITSGQGGYGLWTATMATSSLSAGTHTITATYTDINYSLGTSNVQTVYAGNNASSLGIYSPVNGTTLTGTSMTFRWFPVPGAQFWLDIGPTQGSNVYYQSGNLGTILAMAVPGLPSDGSTVWARLYYLVNGNWSYVDSSYTAYNPNSTKGVITSPVPGSTLTGSSVTFSWSAGSGATAYWIDAGSSAGGNQYYQSGNLGNILTKTVTGLPTDGSTVYVTLYSLVGGNWLNNQYTYTAFGGSGAQGVITTPTPGSTFTGSSVTFDWAAGAGATAYWLDIGNVAGGNQYYQSGNLGNVLTVTVNGLPTDGSTVYVTLYSLVGGNWLSNAYTYTAFNSGASLGIITSPVPGSTLSGNVATFNWSAGSGATSYWLDVGSTVGGNDYYQSGNLGNVLTTTVYSLPANNTTIYVTLYSYVGGQWLYNQYTYTSGP